MGIAFFWPNIMTTFTTFHGLSTQDAPALTLGLTFSSNSRIAAEFRLASFVENRLDGTYSAFNQIGRL
jgi:hypothetical protein